MAINDRLAELLKQREAEVEVVPHREAFTSQEIAHSTHLSGRNVAKVVVLRDEWRDHLMAVLPASEHVELEALRRVTGRSSLEIASEEDLRRLFPDCELGAMPPFGNLYGLPMYVDACLAEHDIWFQAGNHHEIAHMSFKTYSRLARPYVGGVCFHRIHIPMA
jgi:Ala-tRNA(Pro) deacylase